MAVMPPSGSSTRPRLPCLPKTSSSSATLVLAGRFFTRITVLLRSPAACHIQWGKKGDMGFKKAKPSILLTEDFRSNTLCSLTPRHPFPGSKRANTHLENTSYKIHTPVQPPCSTHAHVWRFRLQIHPGTDTGLLLCLQQADRHTISHHTMYFNHPESSCIFKWTEHCKGSITNFKES